jgi:hypothetical protein
MRLLGSTNCWIGDMSIKPCPLLPPDLPEQFTGRDTLQLGIPRQLLLPPPATRLCSKYDDCKRFPAAHGRLRYRLRNSQVWVTDFGFHHSGYLDPIPVDSTAPFATLLDEDLRQYLERNLHFNRHRFENQVKLVKPSDRWQGCTCSMSAVAGGFSSPC